MANIDFINKDDLEDFRVRLLADLRELFENKPIGQAGWLRSSDVKGLLRISGGTLQNFRIKGILPFKKIGGIFYYAQADIDKLLDELGRQ